MKTPTFDAEGYPTEETLKAIEQWPYDDANGCLDFVKAAWHWSDWASHELRPEELAVVHGDDDDRFLRLATGGWSGNENLVAALKRNSIIRAFTWRLSASGGLHIFRYNRWK